MSKDLCCVSASERDQPQGRDRRVETEQVGCDSTDSSRQLRHAAPGCRCPPVPRHLPGRRFPLFPLTVGVFPGRVPSRILPRQTFTGRARGLTRRNPPPTRLAQGSTRQGPSFPFTRGGLNLRCEAPACPNAPPPAVRPAARRAKEGCSVSTR